MSYIGNTNTTQGFIPAIDYFSGNGSTVAFTLSRPVASVAQVQANISNVPQNPSSAFSVSGNTITFTSAPPSGTNNIYVYYTSPITQVIAPGQNTVYPSSLSYTNALYWDASGNVGVGTTSPTSKLTVDGDIQVLSTNYLNFTNTAQQTYLRAPASNTLAFGTNSTERIRIDSAGNVGIGTNAPNTTLTVKTASSAGTQIYKTSDNSSNLLGLYDGQAAGNAAYTLLGTDTTGSTVGFASGGNFLSVGRNGAASVKDLIIHNYDAANIRFATSNIERARIDSGGNLLVGQFSGSYVISAAANANNGAKITNLVMGRSGGEYGSVGYGVRYTGTTNSYTYDQSDTASMIRFNSGKVETLTAPIGTAGNAISFTTGPYVAQGGISWTNGSSDVRQKKNFEPTQGLAEILQVEPIKYHFNWEDDTAPKKMGFKAQNLLPLIPEMVVEKDEKAEDGSPYLTITPDYMLPVLVKAIQEQQAIIQTLTDRITALENK